MMEKVDWTYKCKMLVTSCNTITHCEIFVQVSYNYRAGTAAPTAAAAGMPGTTAPTAALAGKPFSSSVSNPYAGKEMVSPTLQKNKQKDKYDG